MYKKILLATDGSELATLAIRHGLTLAKSIDAAAIAVYVIKPVDVFAPPEIAIGFPAEELSKGAEAHARHALDGVRGITDELGVPCNLQTVHHIHPSKAIIATATQEGCDLIVMGSDGRTGLVGLVLGSETQKVLALSSIPVLVHR